MFCNSKMSTQQKFFSVHQLIWISVLLSNVLAEDYGTHLPLVSNTYQDSEQYNQAPGYNRLGYQLPVVAQPADQASNFYFDVNNGQASKVRLVSPVNSVKSPGQLAKESGGSFVKSVQTGENAQAFFAGPTVFQPSRSSPVSKDSGARFQDQSVEVTEPGKTNAFSRPQSPPPFKGKVRRVMVVPSKQRQASFQQATKDVQQEQNKQVFEENTQKNSPDTNDERNLDQVDQKYSGRKKPLFSQKPVSRVVVPQQQSTKQTTSSSAVKSVTNGAPFRQRQQFTKSSFQSSSKTFSQQQQLVKQKQEQLNQPQQVRVEEQAQQVLVPVEYSQNQLRVEENPQQRVEVQQQQNNAENQFNQQQQQNNAEEQFDQPQQQQQQQSQDDNSQLTQTPDNEQRLKKEHREQHVARFESKSVILESDGKTEHEVKREQARQYNIKSNSPQQSLYTPYNYKPKFVTQPRCVCYP